MRRQKGLQLRRGADRTGEPILTNKVFHDMHVILSLKLGDGEGLALFVLGHLLKRTLLVVLPMIDPDPDSDLCIPGSSSCLLPRPVWGLPGASWQLLVGLQGPGTQLREIQYRYCIFCIVFVIIINIISVICKTFYIQFVSLSPFSFFSLPLVGEWGLTKSICHSVY